jgi:hypothetical protein
MCTNLWPVLEKLQGIQTKKKLKKFTHSMVVNNLVTQGITSIFTKNFVGRNRLTAFGEAEKKFKGHIFILSYPC